MGKKRIIKKTGSDSNAGNKARKSNRVSKKKIIEGVLHIQASFNNTLITLSDKEGNAVLAASSGALGFKGSKKGTPFAAGKVGESLADQAQSIGLKSVDVVIKGVGAGREAAIRAFITQGIIISSILDNTPIPFNGPRPPKPRRV